MSEAEPQAEPQAAPPKRRLRRFLIGGAALLALLLSLPVGAWFLLPRLDFAHIAAGRASAMLGRAVTIDTLRITPGERVGIVLRGFKLANIEGGSRPEMVQLQALTAELDLMALLRGTVVLRQAQVDGLSVLLERNAERQANWHFGPTREGPPAPPDRSGFPRFERIGIARSEIIFRTSGGLVLPTRLEAASLTSEGLDEPVMLRAEGSYNAVPLILEGPLGSIAAFRDARTPYSMDVTATAKETTLALIGSATDPLNFDGVQGRLELRAPHPRTLIAIAGAGADGAPDVSLDLAGTLDRQGDVWRLSALDGELGDAPFTGTLLQFTEGTRGQADALALNLALTRLDLNRLLGSGDSGTDMPLAIFANPDPLIEARLTARELIYDQLRAREVALHAAMVPGQIRVDALTMQAFGARISATGRLEALQEDIQVTADVSLQDGDMDVLRRALGMRDLPLSGRVEGRIAVVGRGRSLNAAGRDAHISAVLAMSGGSIAREVVEMASTDIRALFRTARGRTRLSCLIAVLDMRAGQGEVAPLRLRSAAGTISGIASFDLRRQRMDLVIGSQRQTTGIFALDVPVRVSGSFADPEILPAQWSGTGRARLAAGDQVAPLPPALRDFARRSPCFFAGPR